MWTKEQLQRAVEARKAGGQELALLDEAALHYARVHQMTYEVGVDEKAAATRLDAVLNQMDAKGTSWDSRRLLAIAQKRGDSVVIGLMEYDMKRRAGMFTQQLMADLVEPEVKSQAPDEPQAPSKKHKM
jgi:hypothetical protein